MKKRAEDFKQEAVRIALTSGLARRRVASDIGVGLSTLSKWVAVCRPMDLLSAPSADLAKENERLRLENRILKEERDILKKAQNAMGSSSQAKSHEVWVYQRVAPYFFNGTIVQYHAGHGQWLS